MATSIGDLLTVLNQTSADRSAHDSGDAARALDRSTRLLTRLRVDGIGAAGTTLRDDTARRLADACAETTSTFGTGSRGRIGDLVGVTSDAVAQLRRDLSDEDRWSVAVTLATTTRRCAGIIASSGPYAQVPQLLGVADRARELIHAAAISPPLPDKLAGHDLPIPTSILPRDVSPARIAAESMAALVAHFRARGREPMSLRELLAACYAGETVASIGILLASKYNHLNQTGAAVTWRQVRAELARFTDGRQTKPEPPGYVLRCALQVHEATQRIIAEYPPGTRGANHRLGPEAELARRAVLLLPALETSIRRELSRPATWIVTGGPRPLHEGRVTEWLQHKPFLARGEDLYPAISALHQAAHETNRLTAALTAPRHPTTSCSSFSRARAEAALSRP